MLTLGTHRSFSFQRAFYPYKILDQSSPKIVHGRRHLGIYLATWRCLRHAIEFNLKFGGKLEHTTRPFAVMPFCSAPYCSNRSQRDGRKGISFHRLAVKRKNLGKAKPGTKSSCQKKNPCIFVPITSLMTVLKWTTDIISSVVKLAKERKNQT